MLHKTQAEEHGLTNPVPGAIGSGVLLWIYVEDLGVIFRRAKRLEAAIIVEPHAILEQAGASSPCATPTATMSPSQKRERVNTLPSSGIAP